MLEVASVFTLLNNRVKELAVSRFSEPTEIQKRAIPEVLEGKNVLVIAQTGSGKTESLMLPVFSKMLELEKKPITTLYITPLRALNRNMFERLIWWCNSLGFEASVRHGDTTQYERKLQTEYPPDLLITTPEQLNSMILGKRLREFLKNIKFIVVDEVHELIDSKRGVQLAVVLERIKELCGKPQILALSATVGSPEEAAKFIGCSSVVSSTEAKLLKIKVESPTPEAEDKILAEKVFIGDSVAARLRRIAELTKTHHSVLTFTNTREAAEVLSSRLRLFETGQKHEVHHSSLSKEVRVKVEKDFKEEVLKSIICTSSLQLGIDIGSIDLVIQYQSPREVTQLTQRIGRAGHSIEKVSEGIIISGEGDDLFESTVIARKALAGELEPIRFYENCFDVLTHQLVGIASETYGIDIKKALSIIQRAYPYRNFSEKDFSDLIKFLETIHILWSSNGLHRGRKALQYYFENLSVIPDNRSYKVIDIAANSPVGSLDEAFVAEHCLPGATFIFKGRPWAVVSVEKDKVFAQASADIESSVPAWQGELIPVPFSVAQEVAALRRLIADNIENKNLTELLKKKYPISSTVAEKMTAIIKKQVKFFIPDEKTLVFETYGDFTVLHSPFGSLVNETLSRFISALIAAETGSPVNTKSDPYRIVFSQILPEAIKRVLFQYKPEDIGIILEKSLVNSSLFKHRFLHVAKRFGAIRKDASLEKISMDRIIRAFEGTPVIQETLRELFIEKLDLTGAESVLRELNAGKIQIKDFAGLSPLGEEGLKYELHDIAKPDRPEAEIMRIFKQRLLGTKLRLVCVNCGKYSVTKVVKDIDEEPRCPKCKSKLLAAISPYETEMQNIVKKRMAGKALVAEEHKRLERAKRSADMVIVYGKKACIALAGRGVGPQTASRILARMHRTDQEFYKDILKAEKQFIETKKFWSN